MHKRYIIPPKLVEEYKYELCFEVDTNVCITRAVEPRTKLLPQIRYEMNIDETPIKIK